MCSSEKLEIRAGLGCTIYTCRNCGHFEIDDDIWEEENVKETKAQNSQG